MPPLGARRPDEATYRSLVEELETSLDRGAASRPSPGAPVAHRLNRAEYANAIRDLLALDVDTASLLPPDDSAYGFDNVSDVLNVSPSLQERYLSAARKISALAIGDVRITPSESTYRVRQDRSQNQHVEGLPLGTIGGTLVRHTFPLDGEYLFQTRLFRTNLGMMRGLEYAHRIEYTDRRRARAPRHDWRQHGPRRRVRAADRDRRRDGSAPPRPPAGEGRSSRWSASPSSRICPASTPCGCSRSCGARTTRSTGPAGPTSRCSRYPARSIRAVPGTRRAGAASSRAARRRARTRCRVPGASSTSLARRAYRRPPTPRGSRPRVDVLRSGEARGVVRNRHTGARCSSSWRAPISRSASNATRTASRRAPPTASATSSWRRACRSSSGAASRTTSCWMSRRAGG